MRDDLLRRFDAALQSRTRASWPVCHLAARVVGRFDGETAEIARQRGLHPSTIEKWARASKMWRIACRSMTVEMRNLLTVTHFSAAYEIYRIATCPENAPLAVALLYRALDPPGGGIMSVADMRSWAASVGQKPPPASPLPTLARLYEWAERADISPPARRTLLDALNRVKEIIIPLID